VITRDYYFQIPVLGYHSLHAHGNDYTINDHIALEHDLRLIQDQGFSVLSASNLVNNLLNKSWANLTGKYVVLSFDDAPDVDYYNYQHPDFGCIKSFHTLLQQYNVPGISFVIASQEARSELDKTCIAGRNEWRDNWWNDAINDGLLEIGNHSWDHNHDTLQTVAQRNQEKGNFHVIDTWEDADNQIRKAEQYIQSKTRNRATGLFAYPYGQTNEYLLQQYLPAYQHQHTIKAAFTVAGKYVTPDTSRWEIPRFICGEHWKSSEEL
jgi:peptidoglycan/xylan/chitin deacetylase (PgdA/CDA1 family)